MVYHLLGGLLTEIQILKAFTLEFIVCKASNTQQNKLD